MNRFNLILIKIAIGLIIVCIAHTISDSFESGGIAIALFMTILQYINKKTKED